GRGDLDLQGPVPSPGRHAGRVRAGGRGPAGVALVPRRRRPRDRRGGAPRGGPGEPSPSALGRRPPRLIAADSLSFRRPAATGRVTFLHALLTEGTDRMRGQLR